MVLPPLQGGILVFVLPEVTLRSPPAIICDPFRVIKMETRGSLISHKLLLLNYFICVHLWFFNTIRGSKK